MSSTQEQVLFDPYIGNDVKTKYILLETFNFKTEDLEIVYDGYGKKTYRLKNIAILNFLNKLREINSLKKEILIKPFKHGFILYNKIDEVQKEILLLEKFKPIKKILSLDSQEEILIRLNNGLIQRILSRCLYDYMRILPRIYYSTAYDPSPYRGGNSIKINKYKAYLKKFTLEKIKNIAINKKIKITSKSTKTSIIARLIKHKFSLAH